MSRQNNNRSSGKKKLNRVIIGSVLKGEGDNPNKPTMYVKFKQDVTFSAGQTVSIETKKFRLASLAAAVEAGRLSEDRADEIRAGIEKTPDFVVGDLVQLVDAQ